MFNMLCLQPAVGIYFILMDSRHRHHCEIPDFYDPSPPRQKKSASEIFTFCFASRCMQPNIWTPPWVKCMNLTSKGRADTEAHQDDLATDRTSSKHLAPTLLQSLALYLKRAPFPIEMGMWRVGVEVEKGMAAACLGVRKITFKNVLKVIFAVITATLGFLKLNMMS